MLQLFVGKCASLNNIQERREKQAKKEIDEEGQQVAATLRRFTTRQKAFAKLQTEQVLVNIEFPPDDLIHVCID